MKLFKTLFLLAIMGGVLFTSCTSDDDDDPAVTNGVLELNMNNIPNAPTGFTYFAWLIGDSGVNLKLGDIGATLDSNLFVTFTIGDLDFLSTAESVLISMESASVDPSSPSKYKIASAQFGVSATHSGTFSSSPMRVSQDDFSASTGLYFLGTPTTSTMSEETSGIWFGDNNGGSPIASLNLPDLSEGWVYQGWIDFGQGMMLRTGKFTDPTMADLASPYSGPLSGYDFPGEDFNQNLPMMGTPPNLVGKEVLVTVQPDTLTDTYFPMEIFQNTIAGPAATNDVLTNVHDAIGGSATRK